MARIGKDLDGKVAVITGASSGIGARQRAAVRRRPARKVVVGYNKGVERANAVVRELAGGGHKAMRLPLEDTAQIRKVAAAVREEFGRADILVNSAGFTRMVPHHDLEALDDDLIDQVLTANVRGPFATIRAFAPLLKAIGRRRHRQHLVGRGASTAPAARSSTAPRKRRSNTMSMALARVLGPEIRVVVVAPGMVHTGFVPGRTEEMMAKAAMATPLKRAIEPEDVALAVISCVTHLTHTTGSIISVDAGRHL